MVALGEPTLLARIETVPGADPGATDVVVNVSKGEKAEIIQSV